MPKTTTVVFKRAVKRVTFTGGAGLGAVGAVELFNVTGKVLVLSALAYCSTDLAGASATIKLGTADAPGLISTNFSTTATDVNAGDVWGGGVAGALTDGVNVNNMGNTGPFALVDDDIILTIEAANVTGGVVTVEVMWTEILDGGSVNPA